MISFLLMKIKDKTHLKNKSIKKQSRNSLIIAYLDENHETGIQQSFIK